MANKNSICHMYCIEFNDHTDSDEPISEAWCEDTKAGFRCIQRTQKPFTCNEECLVYEEGGYPVGLIINHNSMCKYIGFTIFIIHMDLRIVTIIKNNKTKEETEICAYNNCYCIDN